MLQNRKCIALGMYGEGNGGRDREGRKDRMRESERETERQRERHTERVRETQRDRGCTEVFHAHPGRECS